MGEHTIKARIQLKNDTEQNWKKTASNWSTYADYMVGE